MEKTTNKEPPAANRGENAVCDYCGMPYVKYRPNQVFCSQDHRRAFERIIHRIASRLYPEIRAGVREILKEQTK